MVLDRRLGGRGEGWRRDFSLSTEGAEYIEEAGQGAGVWFRLGGRSTSPTHGAAGIRWACRSSSSPIRHRRNGSTGGVAIHLCHRRGAEHDRHGTRLAGDKDVVVDAPSVTRSASSRVARRDPVDLVPVLLGSGVRLFEQITGPSRPRQLGMGNPHGPTHLPAGQVALPGAATRTSIPGLTHRSWGAAFSSHSLRPSPGISHRDQETVVDWDPDGDRQPQAPPLGARPQMYLLGGP